MATVAESFLKRSLEAAARYLLDVQEADGSWQDFNCFGLRATDWVTGYVGGYLSELSIAVDDKRHQLLRAVSYLKASQRARGGWGYNDKAPVDADSTAWCLRFMLRMGENVNVTPSVLSLLKHQSTSGGFRTYLPGTTSFRLDLSSDSGYVQPTPCVSGASVLALSSLDSRAFRKRESLDQQYLIRAVERDGSWRSMWWPDSVYPTTMAIKAVSLWRAQDVLRHRAIIGIASLQQRDGSWLDNGQSPSAFLTGLGLDCLGAEPRDSRKEHLRSAVRWLVENQLPDGSWRESVELRIPEAQCPSMVQSVETDQARIFTTATVANALSRVFANLRG